MQTAAPGPDGAAAAIACLDTVLAAAPVACLLIAPEPGRPLDAGLTKTLAGMAQKKGVAALVADDANLARLIKADGVHLSWSKDTLKHYDAARELLGERFMIGADAGRSRDDAMELGEAGAEYVAFGIPAHVEDRATAEDRQRDLIGWWSEIFEIPCVAFDVTQPDHASALAGDGADFVTVTISSTLPPAEIRARIAAFADAITPASTPPITPAGAAS
ncbi:MAG: thiamine phosphate synthase [Hyphomicrobium sp.]|nr:thiamine phosphate synthase [Hyphomicrobium sp.]